MKKYFVLLLFLLCTQFFAQEQPTVSGIKNIYILEGEIDVRYAITMYLTIAEDLENNTKTVSGTYYYNNVREFIYLGESVLQDISTITLREFATAGDAYRNETSFSLLYNISKIGEKMKKYHSDCMDYRE